MENKYGVRWIEFAGREQRATSKEKFFVTAAQQAKFVEKLEQRDGFLLIEAWADQQQEAAND